MVRLTGEFPRKLGNESALPEVHHPPTDGQLTEVQISQGVFDLLLHANKDDKDYKYTFNGDLNQMFLQENYLKLRGFDIGHLDVYPAVKTEEEFNQAIALIFKSRVPGWWHYKDKLIEQGFCTESEWTSLV